MTTDNSALRPGRPEAAAAIWDWGGQRATANDAEVRRSTRVRGLYRALVGGLVAAGFLYFGSRTLGFVVLGIAGVTLAAALFSPAGLYAKLESALAWLAGAVGRGLTVVLMTSLFYTIFLPFGALFRRGRKDPLLRFYDRDATSYWKDRQEPTDTARERQF